MATAAYPAQKRVFTDKVDETDIVFAEHVNLLQAEMEAVQTELGLTPSDTHDTVADFLTHLNTVKYQDGSVLKAASGSAASPGHGFSAETGIGMYRPAPSTLGFSLGGSEVLRLAAGGTTVSGGLTVTGGFTVTGSITGIDHGAVTGLSGDDHTQYLNAARHDARDHSAVASTFRLDEVAQPTSQVVFNGQHLKNTGRVMSLTGGTRTAPSFGFEPDRDTGMYTSGPGDLSFTAAGGVRTVTLDASTNPGFRPGEDNQANLGSPTDRWVEVFAIDGTINTSDATSKEQIEEDDLGLDFLLAVGSKKWRRAGGKRPHYGPVAQDVKQVMDNRGVDFAGFIDPHYAIDELEDECPFEEGRERADHPNASEECAAWHADLQRQRESVSLGLRLHEFIGPIITALGEVNDRLAALESA